MSHGAHKRAWLDSPQAPDSSLHEQGLPGDPGRRKECSEPTPQLRPHVIFDLGEVLLPKQKWFVSTGPTSAAKAPEGLRHHN